MKNSSFTACLFPMIFFWAFYGSERFYFFSARSWFFPRSHALLISVLELMVFWFTALILLICAWTSCLAEWFKFVAIFFYSFMLSTLVYSSALLFGFVAKPQPLFNFCSWIELSSPPCFSSWSNSWVSARRTLFDFSLSVSPGNVDGGQGVSLREPGAGSGFVRPLVVSSSSARPRFPHMDFW
jgi:hypothetical protein